MHLCRAVRVRSLSSQSASVNMAVSLSALDTAGNERGSPGRRAQSTSEHFFLTKQHSLQLFSEYNSFWGYNGNVLPSVAATSLTFTLWSHSLSLAEKDRHACRDGQMHSAKSEAHVRKNKKCGQSWIMRVCWRNLLVKNTEYKSCGLSFIWFIWYGFKTATL